ncbi:MAG: mechanosensitive ion channel family protein, partial [Bacteroidota bacterium]|nr:mechanosensitive ion channel family protein [Bacteroidota bacterium]
MALAETPAQAQLPLQKKEQSNDTAAAVPDWPADTLGRRTPRGAVQGFISSLADENYARAALYLNLTRKQKKQGEQLAHTLQRLLDHGGEIIPYSLISDNYNGREDDNLGPNLDRVGSATANGETFELFLEKTEDASGGPIWLFSSQTVQRIPKEIDQASTPLADRVMPEVVVKNKWGGVPIGHWLAMLLIALGGYAISWCLVHAFLFVLRKSWHRASEEPITGIISAFILPLQLYLALWFFFEYSQRAGISIIVRQRFSVLTVIIGLFVFLLLLWRLIDVLGRFLERRMIRHQHQAGLSAVLFLRRGAKIAVLVFGAIGILSTLGFDVTTGLAALG